MFSSRVRRVSSYQRVIQKLPLEVFYKKRCCWKFRKIHTKTPVPVSLACNFFKKETLAQVFSCEFCEIFKNIFFTEHLRVTASGNSIVHVQLSFFIILIVDSSLPFRFVDKNLKWIIRHAVKHTNLVTLLLRHDYFIMNRYCFLLLRSKKFFVGFDTSFKVLDLFFCSPLH